MMGNVESNTTVSSVVLTGYGGYEKIQVQSTPFPVLKKSSQVLVKVKACGLNFADIYTRQGLVKDTPLPFVMGLECSGVILKVGSEVSTLKKGDRVLVHTGKHGLHSEVVCVESGDCHIIPDEMPWEEAAAFPVNYLTAYFCLFKIGHIQEGQTILIPSAAGGVGCAATQLAKMIPNVKVVGIASAAKHEAIKENGVDICIDSNDPLWYESVKLACPGGVDIAIDSTSGDHFNRTQQLVSDLGKAILIGANGMIEGETLSWMRCFSIWWNTKYVNPTDLILNNRTVAGFHLNHVKERSPQRYLDALNLLLEMYQDKKIKPRIDTKWKLTDVVGATDRLAQRRATGKIVLTTSM